MRCAKAFGGFVFLCVVASCVSQPVSVETSGGSSSIPVLTKLCVLIDIGDRTVSVGTSPSGEPKDVYISDYLREKIEESLKARSVEARALRLSGVELEDDIKKAIDDYGAPNTMTVELENGQVYTSSKGLVAGDFVVTIYNSDSQKAIWKARIKAKGKVNVLNNATFNLSSDELDKVVSTMMAAMTTDGLLKQRGTPPGT